MATRPVQPTSPSQKDLEKAIAWANLFTALVDRIGWPGLLVVFFGAIMFFWASADQKRQFIDLYILGKGIGQIWPLVVLSVIFAATVLAQLRVYGKKIALLKRELERVGDEKSLLQQELTATKLRRGKPKTEDD
jgi:hypothetical protein